MLSRTAEYAIRAALWLAADTRQPQAAQLIARGTAIPAGYLAKVLQALGRAGIVTAQPGPGGGFLLNRAPADIPLLTVIDAIDPIVRISACPPHGASRADRLCPLHARVDAAQAYLQETFRNCTLADLLTESGGDAHLLCGAVSATSAGGTAPDSHDAERCLPNTSTKTNAAGQEHVQSNGSEPIDGSYLGPADRRRDTKGKQP